MEANKCQVLLLAIKQKQKDRLKRLILYSRLTQDNDRVDQNLAIARMRAKKHKGFESHKARRAEQVARYEASERLEMQNRVEVLAEQMRATRAAQRCDNKEDNQSRVNEPRYLALKAAVHSRMLGDPVRLSNADRLKPGLGAPARVSDDMKRLRASLQAKLEEKRAARQPTPSRAAGRASLNVLKDKKATPAQASAFPTDRIMEVRNRALQRLDELVVPGGLGRDKSLYKSRPEIRHGTRLGDYERNNRLYQEDIPNKWRSSVEMSRICVFCSDDEGLHFRRWSCPIYLAYLSTIPITTPNRDNVIAGQIFCEYPGCKSPKTHLLPACTTLHRLCAGCGLRGHALAGCPQNSAHKAILRARFDKYKALGYYTRRSGDWGFLGPALARKNLRFCRVQASKAFIPWFSARAPFAEVMTDAEKVRKIRVIMWR
jgi:hypothetical protein